MKAEKTGSMLLSLVPKPVLGRGLGKLMQEANPAPPRSDDASKPANLSPGMATLFKGANGNEQTRAGQEPAEATQAGSRNWRWRAPLLLADALLIGFGVRLALKSREPLDFTGVGLCVLAFGLGAWLMCLAIWPRQR